MMKTRDRIFGKIIIITDRVKPGKLYKYEGYVLVHPSNHEGFILWMTSTAERVPRGMFDKGTT